MNNALARNEEKKTYLILTFWCLSLIILYLILSYAIKVSSSYSLIPLYLAIVGAGIPLLIQLFKKVSERHFDADLLAGISIITALFLGEYLAASIVILMLAGGHALEEFAYREASNILSAIAKRMPFTAHKRIGGKHIEIPCMQIDVGDHISIFPYEICPVDGTVLEGQGLMDESFLTGEPFHIRKTSGSKVLSGAINGEGVLTIRADKVAANSRYSQVMRVMLEAEKSHIPIKRLSEKIAIYFTPLSLLIASTAWLISGEATRFLSVLVIATPCPLLLAIPVAVIGTISLAAKRGIIIKNPALLEEISNCKAIIFDKTGTLTYGKPELPEIIPSKEISSDELLRLTASLEHYSKHPLAKGILDKARNQALVLEAAENIKEEPGKGLSGYVKGNFIEITGRKNFCALRPEESKLLPNEGPGLECIVMINHKYAGTMLFHDEIRQGTQSFISHLKPCHEIQSVLLVSGDREVEVKYLAEKVGIKEIYFNQSPEEKVRIVKDLSKNTKTLFIGDGINDAPALAAATLGISFGHGNDITIEAADATIIDSDLKKLDELFHLSKRMKKIALQSALGGMFLSTAGMLIAGSGLFTPVIWALSQELIDLIAVLNALRASKMPANLSDYGCGTELAS